MYSPAVVPLLVAHRALLQLLHRVANQAPNHPIALAIPRPAHQAFHRVFHQVSYQLLHQVLRQVLRLVQNRPHVLAEVTFQVQLPPIAPPLASTQALLHPSHRVTGRLPHRVALQALLHQCHRVVGLVLHRLTYRLFRHLLHQLRLCLVPQILLWPWLPISIPKKLHGLSHCIPLVKL